MIINGKERDYILHDSGNIKGLFGEFRYLSNFEVCDVEIDGDMYGSSEAAYMAQKTLDKEVRKLFLKSIGITPVEARKLGQTIEVRVDWNDFKLIAMRKAVGDKFLRNKDLQEKLLSTNDKYIEETNHWNDHFWGVCNNFGENNLGKILMALREIVKELNCKSGN